MPSGGGSFGGGGGGGGFSGGGGFGGGGGFHHHHYGGSRYRYGGGYGYSRGRSWGCGIVITVVVFVVLVISLSSSVSRESAGSGDTFYSPGDTRLVELNTLFCKRVTLSEKSALTDADLYLLTEDEVPPITDRNNFTIATDVTINSQEYQFWQYHLYRNSNITVTACITQGSSVSLFIFKGNDNYNNWLSDGSSSYAYLYKFISQSCGSGTGGTTTTTVNVRDEDEWYVVLANTGTGIDQVSIELKFERFQYSTKSLSGISQQCSTSSNGDCSVDVDFRSNRKYGLIVTSIPQTNVDWGENVDIEWDCSRNDLGYFLAIGVPILSLLLIALIGVGIGVLIFCFMKHKPNISSWGRLSSPPSATTTTKNENDVPEEVLKMQQSETRTEPPPPYGTYPDPPPYAPTV